MKAMKKLFLSLLLILTVLPALSQDKPKRSLFPVKRHGPVAAVPGLHLDLRVINKHCFCFLLYRLNQYIIT